MRVSTVLLDIFRDFHEETGGNITEIVVDLANFERLWAELSPEMRFVGGRANLGRRWIEFADVRVMST